MRSVGFHDNVGIVCGPDEKLVHGSHVPETRGKVRVPGGRTFMQNCVKRSRGLTYLLVVYHKLWRGQLREPPVHSGRFPQVVVVAQKADGPAVLPGDGTQSSPALEFVLATFSQPPAEFLWVVPAAWHDGARGQDSQFVLQQVEEHDGVLKAVHEQHVVLVDDLRVIHKTADNTADPLLQI